MSLRADLAIISDWIAPNSRVLDLGCGDGALLAHLRRTRQVSGYGLEIDSANVVKCIENGVDVIHTNIDAGLSEFADNFFDYVIMTQTLQAVRYPDKVLTEMLRVGREVLFAVKRLSDHHAIGVAAVAEDAVDGAELGVLIDLGGAGVEDRRRQQQRASLWTFFDAGLMIGQRPRPGGIVVLRQTINLQQIFRERRRCG